MFGCGSLTSGSESKGVSSFSISANSLKLLRPPIRSEDTELMRLNCFCLCHVTWPLWDPRSDLLPGKVIDHSLRDSCALLAFVFVFGFAFVFALVRVVMLVFWDKGRLRS